MGKKAAKAPRIYDRAATDRLWEAVARGSSRDDPKVAEALAAGADPNADDWEGRETPLLMALAMGRPGAAKLLLAAGADPNRENDYDQTPLAMAAAQLKGSARMIKMLVAAGARVDHVNAKGWTALMDAADSVNPEAMEALIDAGADVGHKSPLGWTPMVVAIGGGGLADPSAGRACVELLLARGAELRSEEVERAEAWGKREIADWLASALLARREAEDLSEATEGAARAAKPKGRRAL